MAFRSLQNSLTKELQHDDCFMVGNGLHEQKPSYTVINREDIGSERRPVVLTLFYFKKSGQGTITSQLALSCWSIARFWRLHLRLHQSFQIHQSSNRALVQTILTGSYRPRSPPKSKSSVRKPFCTPLVHEGWIKPRNDWSVSSNKWLAQTNFSSLQINSWNHCF